MSVRMNLQQQRNEQDFYLREILLKLEQDLSNKLQQYMESLICMVTQIHLQRQVLYDRDDVFSDVEVEEDGDLLKELYGDPIFDVYDDTDQIFDDCLDAVPCYDVYVEELSREPIYDFYHDEFRFQEENKDFDLHNVEDIQFAPSGGSVDINKFDEKYEFLFSHDMVDLESMDKKISAKKFSYPQYMRFRSEKIQFVKKMSVFASERHGPILSITVALASDFILIIGHKKLLENCAPESFSLPLSYDITSEEEETSGYVRRGLARDLWHYEIFFLFGLKRKVGVGWIFLSCSLSLLVRSVEEHGFLYAACVGRFILHWSSHVAFLFDENGARKFTWTPRARANFLILCEEYSEVIMLIFLTLPFSSDLHCERYKWKIKAVWDPQVRIEYPSLTKLCWNDVYWKPSKLFCSCLCFHVQTDTSVFWPPLLVMLPIYEDIYTCLEYPQYKQWICLQTRTSFFNMIVIREAKTDIMQFCHLQLLRLFNPYSFFVYRETVKFRIMGDWVASIVVSHDFLSLKFIQGKLEKTRTSTCVVIYSRRRLIQLGNYVLAGKGVSVTSLYSLVFCNSTRPDLHTFPIVPMVSCHWILVDIGLPWGASTGGLRVLCFSHMEFSYDVTEVRILEMVIFEGTMKCKVTVRWDGLRSRVLFCLKIYISCGVVKLVQVYNIHKVQLGDVQNDMCFVSFACLSSVMGVVEPQALSNQNLSPIEMLSCGQSHDKKLHAHIRWMYLVQVIPRPMRSGIIFNVVVSIQVTAFCGVYLTTIMYSPRCVARIMFLQTSPRISSPSREANLYYDDQTGGAFSHRVLPFKWIKELLLSSCHVELLIVVMLIDLRDAHLMHKPCFSLVSITPYLNYIVLKRCCHQAFAVLHQAAWLCIRHRVNYCALICLDERHGQQRNRVSILQCLRKSIKLHDSFEGSMERLKSIFPRTKEHVNSTMFSAQDCIFEQKFSLEKKRKDCTRTGNHIPIKEVTDLEADEPEPEYCSVPDCDVVPRTSRKIDSGSAVRPFSWSSGFATPASTYNALTYTRGRDLLCEPSELVCVLLSKDRLPLQAYYILRSRKIRQMQLLAHLNDVSSRLQPPDHITATYAVLLVFCHLVIIRKFFSKHRGISTFKIRAESFSTWGDLMQRILNPS